MRRMGAGSAGPLPDLSTVPAARGGWDIWFWPLITAPPSCMSMHQVDNEATEFNSKALPLSVAGGKMLGVKAKPVPL